MEINPGTGSLARGKQPEPAPRAPEPPAFAPAAAEPPPSDRLYAGLPPDMPQFTSGDPFADPDGPYEPPITATDTNPARSAPPSKRGGHPSQG